MNKKQNIKVKKNLKIKYDLEHEADPKSEFKVHLGRNLDQILILNQI